MTDQQQEVRGERGGKSGKAQKAAREANEQRKRDEEERIQTLQKLIEENTATTGFNSVKTPVNMPPIMSTNSSRQLLARRS